VHGAQGPEDWSVDELDPVFVSDLEMLARAWLEAAARSGDPVVGDAAVTALADLDSGTVSGAQGPMGVTRSAVSALSRVPFFGPATYGVVQRVNRTNLWQVTAYMNDYDNAKAEIWARFEAAAGDDTRVVLAHSLGTVVAFEAIHHLGLEVELLVTTGSPLGLRQVIYPKLTPGPVFPPTVQRWVNVADPDDFIAASTELAQLFPPADGGGEQRVEDVKVRNRGPFARHHDITEYLSHDKVRAVLFEVLDG
jgi:hypothetical protein